MLAGKTKKTRVGEVRGSHNIINKRLVQKRKRKNNQSSRLKDNSHTDRPLPPDNISLHAGVGQLVEQNAHHE